ncbi:MAG: hypothetical protein HC840_04955 [Leptolyngbyaceae cyanobacterium RM2_2_4]|nr:hypothetical protein [Leptolyngbyaceae cyanobacterium RM2_2_4]
MKITYKWKVRQRASVTIWSKTPPVTYNSGDLVPEFDSLTTEEKNAVLHLLEIAETIIEPEQKPQESDPKPEAETAKTAKK